MHLCTVAKRHEARTHFTRYGTTVGSLIYKENVARWKMDRDPYYLSLSNVDTTDGWDWEA